MRLGKNVRVSCMLLCLLLLLSACLPGNSTPSSGDSSSSSAASSGNVPAGMEKKPLPIRPQRRLVPYEDMVYERPDVEGMQARLAELTEVIKAAENYEQLLEADAEAEKVAEAFATAYTLAELKQYQDTTDAYYEEEYRFCSDAAVALDNKINELNRGIIESDFAERYREDIGDYAYQNMVDSLRLNSPEVEPLVQQRNQLDIDYNKMVAAFYAPANLSMVLSTSGDDPYAATAAPFAEIYIQMIALDKQIAEILGFDDAIEMHYLSYGRDYTPADALQFGEYAKKYFLPIFEEVMMVPTGRNSINLDTVMLKAPGILKELNPRIGRAWNDMIRYDLYDFESRPAKQNGIGFTTTISEYDAPFCYVFWENDLRSGTTVFHEFGHFFDGWLHYYDDAFLNLDIAETYSQGLEFLVQHYYDRLFDKPDAARQAHLQSQLDSLLYQLALEEFQQLVYQQEQLDNDLLAQLFAQACSAYGYTFFGPVYTWFYTTHLFDVPFYTISYWTSAVAALQIWATSRDDIQAGVDLYMKLITAEQNQPFMALLEEAGIGGPGDEATLQNIAENFIEVFDLRGIDLPQAA